MRNARQQDEDDAPPFPFVVRICMFEEDQLSAAADGDEAPNNSSPMRIIKRDGQFRASIFAKDNEPLSLRLIGIEKAGKILY